MSVLFSRCSKAFEERKAEGETRAEKRKRERENDCTTRAMDELAMEKVGQIKTNGSLPPDTVAFAEISFVTRSPSKYIDIHIGYTFTTYPCARAHEISHVARGKYFPRGFCETPVFIGKAKRV